VQSVSKSLLIFFFIFFGNNAALTATLLFGADKGTRIKEHSMQITANMYQSSHQMAGR
jgi:hypothetical protein